MIMVMAMEKIKVLEEFIKMVGKKYFDSLIVVGKPGIGKSYTVIETLKKHRIEYVYHTGFRSPLSLYNFLYKHREDLIVFDDTAGIMNNKTAISILDPVLWPVNSKRIVQWGTTSDLVEIPEFEFKGRIIFICNRLPKAAPDVVSRCMVYRLDYSYDELIEIMRSIAQKPSRGLSVKERKMIVEFIAENTDEATRDFNLRLQYKIESIYKYCKKSGQDWKQIALSLLNNRNEKIVEIKRLLSSNMPVREQIQKWMENGWSRRSYFLYKKKVQKCNQI